MRGASSTGPPSWRCVPLPLQGWGTSLIRNRLLLGPCSRHIPMVLRWSQGGGWFLMSEVTMEPPSTVNPRTPHTCARKGTYDGCRGCITTCTAFSWYETLLTEKNVLIGSGGKQENKLILCYKMIRNLCVSERTGPCYCCGSAGGGGAAP